MKITTIGNWHLALVYSTCLAELGNKVSSSARIDTITDISEPRLYELIEKNKKNGRLKFAPIEKETVNKSDIVWILIDTPVDKRNKSDISSILNTITMIYGDLGKNTVLVISSQLPVGTCKVIRGIFPKLKFAYVPENLRLGQSVDNFFNADRVIIGTDDANVYKKVQKVLSKTSEWFGHLTPQTAEMAKHATNAFLATSISFINDIADVCEKVDADVYEIIRALKMDERIGLHAYLGAGLGFSGVTLERDVRVLLSQGINLPVISSVLKKNKSREKYLYDRLKTFIPKLKGKKMAVLGNTYKAGVTTLRGSLPIKIMDVLRKSGVEVETRVKGANALLILSPTNEKIDLPALKKSMKKPYLVFDCYNSFWSLKEKFTKLGFLYKGVGI